MAGPARCPAMIDLVGEPATLALIGLAGGVVLGLAARLGRFCALGAVEDALYAADGTRLRMWGVAAGVAVLGTFALIAVGALDPIAAPYLVTGWVPQASILGGLAFGYGMALAGTCGYGALARLGGGDLRAFVIVLVMGVAAYAVLSGPLAPLRVAPFPADRAVVLQGIPWRLERLAGVPSVTTGLALGGALLGASLWSPRLLARPGGIAWAAAAGLAIVSGWAGTQWVAQAGFAAMPVISHTYAAPLGETLLWTMTASGSSLSFGIGSVAGVILGAVLGSLRLGHFRWEACEDPRELRRQIAGAALMGAGAVVAMGCTVGQGLSALSVLSYSAPVTILSIGAGAALGLRHLIAGFTAAE